MRQGIKQFSVYIFFLLLLLPFRGLAAAQDFPAKPNPPRLVNDFAGFMSVEEQNALEQKLQLYADSTSNEIAIVTVQSIGDYEIADYSVQLFNQWHIGSKKNNNGILILAARDERKIWITTGYGLEGVLPDGLVGHIIRKEIQPAFKQAAYYQGFDNGIDAIIQAAQGAYKADPKEVAAPQKLPAALVLLIIIMILVVATSGRGGGGGGGMLSNAGWIAASMLSNRNYGSGWGGGSSSGGFGGFGGGSSGGGGAGGSW
jgi:uncharacterized protein